MLLDVILHWTFPHLEILSAHEARVAVDHGEGHGAQLIEVEVQDAAVDDVEVGTLSVGPQLVTVPHVPVFSLHLLLHHLIIAFILPAILSTFLFHYNAIVWSENKFSE